MTDEKRINQHQEISSEKEKRQKLMATALKFATVLTTLGISGNVWGAIANAEPVNVPQTEISPKVPDRKLETPLTPTLDRKLETPLNLQLDKKFQTPLRPKQEAAGNLLQEAIKTKDMDGAIRKWGAKAELNREQVERLQQLTKEDLIFIDRFREKFDSVFDDGDTTGYAIF
ncbi:MAG: hypothetical protein ACFB2X_16705 [Rivularia sp. (in: cyanobacteria)]